MTGLAAHEILPHAKRILVYLFRARPMRLLDDLMAELQTVESLSWLVERTETPPFYRLSHLRKTSSYSDTNVPAHGINGSATLAQNHASTGSSQFSRLNSSELEKGTIHTKRRSAEESNVFHQPHLRSSSSGAAHLFRSEKTRTISGPAALPDSQFLNSDKDRMMMSEAEQQSASIGVDTQQLHAPDRRRCPSSETIAVDANATSLGVPSGGNEGKEEATAAEATNDAQSKLVPLPMPEYGGYYAPLKEFLPPQPVAPFHRCNLAMMFIAELIQEGTMVAVNAEESKTERRIDWCSHYLPLMIHMAFLGLDHLRPLVNHHCYNMLINLLVVAGAHRHHLSVSKLALNQFTNDLGLGLSVPHVTPTTYNFLGNNLLLIAVLKYVTYF